MNYYMATTLDVSFDDAIERTEAALKTEGFGVLTRADVQQTLKTKIDVDFRPYTILGACNPELAHQALLLEDKVGTMQAIENPALTRAASAVLDKLSRVIALLAKANNQH